MQVSTVFNYEKKISHDFKTAEEIIIFIVFSKIAKCLSSHLV